MRNFEYQGQKFELSESEYQFVVENDFWEALGEFCHQWDLDNDPGAWDLMMECFVSFMTPIEKEKE